MGAWQKLDQYIKQYVEIFQDDNQAWDDHYVLEADKLIQQFNAEDWNICKTEWVKQNEYWKRCFISLLCDCSFSQVRDILEHAIIGESDSVAYSAADTLRIHVESREGISVSRNVHQRIEMLVARSSGLWREVNSILLTKVQAAKEE